MKKTLNLALWLFLAFAIFTTSCRKKEKDNLPGGGGDTETVGVQDKGKSIEELAEQYFSEHKDESKYAEKLISVANDFFVHNKKTEEFGKKKPCHIQPIYAYGIDGVAYYEIWLTEDDQNVKGWLLISATENDFPLVNFSQGVPYSSRLITEHAVDGKVYRFGPSYFALEKNGQKTAEYGQMPSIVYNTKDGRLGVEGSSKDRKSEVPAPKEGVDYFTVKGYESLKELYGKYYFSEGRKSTAKTMNAELTKRKSSSANARIASDYVYYWVDGPFCYYTQIPPNTGHNTYPCWSGCNNNAWASLFGWWDLNKGKHNLIPTTSDGETSPQYRNTLARQNSVDPVQMKIRELCGTYCQHSSKGVGGSTNWSSMHRGTLYAESLGYECESQYQWCWFSGCRSHLANVLTRGIANNGTPVIVGANSHMYVGWGYAQMPGNTSATWAYCYPAWKENHDDDLWIPWQDFNATTNLTIK
ncbi:hypothetical protein RCC89_06545 [Cytophagaceae bacterium ABcell3]|nr:hypothetical protein RCC89_06545 [Cytophagaceae bacterium ABcell3]